MKMLNKVYWLKRCCYVYNSISALHVEGIENYMMKQSISKSGGFKKNHVDGSWDKALSKMINIQAPQGYEVVDTDDADAEE